MGRRVKKKGKGKQQQDGHGGHPPPPWLELLTPPCPGLPSLTLPFCLLEAERNLGGQLQNACWPWTCLQNLSCVPYPFLGGK